MLSTTDAAGRASSCAVALDEHVQPPSAYSTPPRLQIASRRSATVIWFIFRLDLHAPRGERSCKDVVDHLGCILDALCFVGRALDANPPCLVARDDLR